GFSPVMHAIFLCLRLSRPLSAFCHFTVNVNGNLAWAELDVAVNVRVDVPAGVPPVAVGLPPPPPVPFVGVLLAVVPAQPIDAASNRTSRAKLGLKRRRGLLTNASELKKSMLTS